MDLKMNIMKLKKVYDLKKITLEEAQKFKRKDVWVSPNGELFVGTEIQISTSQNDLFYMEKTEIGDGIFIGELIPIYGFIPDSLKPKEKTDVEKCQEIIDAGIKLGKTHAEVMADWIKIQKAVL